MRTANVLVALAVVAAAFTIIPAAEAGLPIECVMAPCGPGDGPGIQLCKPVDRYDGPVHTTVGEGCATQVDIKAYDCIWNCGWHTYLQGPPLTVRVYEQNDGSQSAQQTSPVPPPCLSGCCADPCPPPCDDCPAPSPCPSAGVDTNALPDVGPVRVRLDGAGAHTQACTVTAWEHNDFLACSGSPEFSTSTAHVSEGPADASAEYCRPQLDCICDPLPIEFTSSSVQMPPPCQYCDPHCPPVEVSTGQFFAYLGPHAGAELTEGCHVNVGEHGLRCDTAVAPLDESQVNEQVYLVGASADTCAIGFICACMPAGMSSAPVPPPCGTCVCASFSVETFEADLTWTMNCRLVVTVHDNVYNCVQPMTVSLGVVTVQPGECQPICACMPASAAPACQPIATTDAVPLVYARFDQGCHATVIVGTGTMCEAYEDTTLLSTASVTVIDRHCGPGIEP